MVKVKKYIDLDTIFKINQSLQKYSFRDYLTVLHSGGILELTRNGNYYAFVNTNTGDFFDGSEEIYSEKPVKILAEKAVQFKCTVIGSTGPYCTISIKNLHTGAFVCKEERSDLTYVHNNRVLEISHNSKPSVYIDIKTSQPIKNPQSIISEEQNPCRNRNGINKIKKDGGKLLNSLSDEYFIDGEYQILSLTKKQVAIMKNRMFLSVPVADPMALSEFKSGLAKKVNDIEHTMKTNPSQVSQPDLKLITAMSELICAADKYNKSRSEHAKRSRTSIEAKNHKMQQSAITQQLSAIKQNIK